MSPCGPAAWLRSGRLSKLPTTPACAGVAARQLENRPRRSSLRSTMAASPSGGRKAKMLSTSASQREAGDRHGFGNRLARSGLAWIMLALLEGRRAWQMAAMVWHRLPAALHKNGRTFVRQCSRDRSEGRACLAIRERSNRRRIRAPRSAGILAAVPRASRPQSPVPSGCRGS